MYGLYNQKKIDRINKEQFEFPTKIEWRKRKKNLKENKTLTK